MGNGNSELVSNEQVCKDILNQACAVFGLGFMNDPGRYLTYDGKNVELLKFRNKNVFLMHIGNSENPDITCKKIDGDFEIFCNINGKMQPLHPLHLEKVENVDNYLEEAKKHVEELTTNMFIGLIRPSDEDKNLSISFAYFYSNLPYSDSRRKIGVVVPAINHLFAVSQRVESKDADYVLYTHPWAAVQDTSKECIEQLKYIDKNRKPGAKIIAVGSATNAKQQLGDSIKDIIYLDGNYVEKLGEMFDVQLKEQYVNYNLEDGILEIFPATGCLRRCSFCFASHKKRDFSSVPLERIKEELDHFQRDFPEGLHTVELFAQNLTEYGIDLSRKQEFPALLRLIASYPEVKEIRLPYGLSMGEMKQPLVEAVIENKDKITVLGLHFETGSNRLLSLTKKGHTKEGAIALLNIIRQEIPNITLYSTMIIGLPTETLEDVEDSVDLIRRTQIDGILCNYYKYSDKQEISKLPQISGNQKKRHFEYFIKRLQEEEFEHPLQIQLIGQPLNSIPGEKVVGADYVTAYNFGNQENRSQHISRTEPKTLLKSETKKRTS